MSFSLRWLFIAIVAIAVCVVALLNANQYWRSAARSAVLFGLSFAIVGAIIFKSRARAFWIGFAVFGLVRLAFSGLLISEWFTWMASDDVISWVHPGIATEAVVGTIGGQRALLVAPKPSFDDFAAVARPIVVMMVGLIGGLVALWAYGRTGAKGSGRTLEGTATDYT